MTKTNKKALALSILSMLMCCAMLIGTTFAWFTDEATAGKNTIVAGTLDVELQDADGETLAADASLFDDEFLWEPGAVLVSDGFKVANVGTLALTYDLALNVVNENSLNGNTLADVIKVAVVDEAPASRDAAIDLDYVALSELKASGKLLPGNADALTVVLYWAPTDNDNAYNVNNGQKTDDDKDALTIEFGVSLFATQTPAEEDTFGSDYDKDAHATQAILATVTAGVDLMNDAMTGYATLGELKNVNGVYTSDVTILIPETTVSQVYLDIEDSLFGAIESQSANINSITISVSDGEDVVSGDTYANNGEFINRGDLLGTIKNILSANNIHGSTPIAVLNGAAINVTIVDTFGVETTYALVFGY